MAFCWITGERPLAPHHPEREQMQGKQAHLGPCWEWERSLPKLVQASWISCEGGKVWSRRRTRSCLHHLRLRPKVAHTTGVFVWASQLCFFHNVGQFMPDRVGLCYLGSVALTAWPISMICSHHCILSLFSISSWEATNITTRLPHLFLSLPNSSKSILKLPSKLAFKFLVMRWRTPKGTPVSLVAHGIQHGAPQIATVTIHTLIF